MTSALTGLYLKVFDRWNLTIDRVGELRSSNNKFYGGLELVNDRLDPVESSKR